MNTNKLSDLCPSNENGIEQCAKSKQNKKTRTKGNSDYVGDHPGKCNPCFSSCFFLFLKVLI